MKKKPLKTIKYSLFSWLYSTCLTAAAQMFDFRYQWALFVIEIFPLLSPPHSAASETDFPFTLSKDTKPTARKQTNKTPAQLPKTNFSSGALHLPLTHFPPLASGMRGANREQERNAGFLPAKWWKSALCVHCRVFRHWRRAPTVALVKSSHAGVMSPLKGCHLPSLLPAFIHIPSYQSSTVCINVFQPGSPSAALHPSAPTGSESHSRWRSQILKQPRLNSVPSLSSNFKGLISYPISRV